MLKNVFIVVMVVFGPLLNILCAQDFTSYFTGNMFNRQTSPEGGVCMMGGGVEHDEAMRWFLMRADSGDVLVLRASGEDGYNSYMYSELGVTVNSVETIVFNNANASNAPYVLNKIRQAEAIWFAGGDQWDYVSYWRNTPVDSLINDAIANRNIVIGGTSAGMAILGKYYFTSQNGTITSPEALSNPYNPLVTMDSTHFLDIEYMHDVVTDTHYNTRDRDGRHVVFLARVLTDFGIAPRGIACDENAAVCLDESGLARVFGNYPDFQEAAYFLQTNCELEDVAPENCSPAQPLNWNLGGAAIRVCKIYGTDFGNSSFDLLEWELSSGGEWENWYVEDGILTQTDGTQIDCNVSSVEDQTTPAPSHFQLVKTFPNPFNPSTTIQFELSRAAHVQLTAYDIQGRQVAQLVNGLLNSGTHNVTWDCTSCSSGIYLIELSSEGQLQVEKAMLLR
ncbi:MAG: Type 1 glutamine amidotransferase-like domain-containing protein [bacterium]|nr:Type 1 glutamine amidotransferase-like domain-containing protein [bacterium]